MKIGNQDSIFSRNLKELRIMKQMTLLDFAQKCGYSANHQFQLENGTATPSEINVQRITEAFDCSKEWLFGESDVPPIVETLDKVQIGERLKLIRKDFHITQGEAARSLGISLRHYQCIEHGDYLIKASLVEQIEDIFHVGRNWLLYGDETAKKYPITRKIQEFLSGNESLRELIWNEFRKNTEEQQS